MTGSPHHSRVTPVRQWLVVLAALALLGSGGVRTREPAESAGTPTSVLIALRVDTERAARRVAAPALAPDAVAAEVASWRRWRTRAVAAAVDEAAGPGRARVEALVVALGGTVTQRVRAWPLLVARVPSDAFDVLRTHPDVAAVAPDRRGLLHLATAVPASGSPAFWAAGWTGGSVTLGLYDSGVYLAHGAFTGLPITSFAATAGLSAAPPEDPDDPNDFSGHGTAVAGAIAARGPASAPHLTGSVPGLERLLNVKVGTRSIEGYADFTQGALAAGLDWSLSGNPTPPDVLNFSLGTTALPYDADPIPQLFDGVASTYGKVVVAAAGDASIFNPSSGIETPGNGYNVLSVAAVDDRNTASRADDAPWPLNPRRSDPPVLDRKKPDLTAPGVGVVTTDYLGGEGSATGTSIAAGVVSGLAALLLDAIAPTTGADLVTRAILINAAEDRGAVGWDADWGWGYVDGARAYAQRAEVLTGSFARGGRYYFRRSFPPGTTKATLVWNRHVTYSSSSPTPSPLRNLDLHVYEGWQAGAERSGETAPSVSAVDNVEQIQWSTPEPTVLVVESPEAASLPAGETIPFALAHDGGFEPASPPSLAMTLEAPTLVGPNARFAVTAVVSNPTASPEPLPLFGATVTLALPPGFTFAPGSTATQHVIGPILANSLTRLTWTIQAPSTVDGVPRTFSAIASTTAQNYGVAVTPAGASAAVTVSGSCTYAVTPASIAAPSSPTTGYTLGVVAPAGCGWAAISNQEWAEVNPASGAGNATLSLLVHGNAGAPRTAIVTVGTASVQVDQAANVRTYSLAEGATGAFFDLDVVVANPNDDSAPIEISFLRPGGAPPVPLSFTLAPKEQRVVRVDEVAGLENTAVSTVVTSPSGAPLLVERTMFWTGDSGGHGGPPQPGESYYGGHGGNAVDAPQRRWYFAEGSQGFFDTYVLLANATAQTASVTLTFLREGAPPVPLTVPVGPTSRENVWTGLVPQLANRSFSIVVDSDVPIIAERAMYFPAGVPPPGGKRFWEGGHESAGVPAPAGEWFHAEGATGAFFDEYILVGNPNALLDATVTFRFLLETGQTVVARKTVPAQSRFTVDVENVAAFVQTGLLELVSGDPALLANAAVSTTVTSTVPIVSERAMYWSGAFTSWYEAHNSFGVTQVAARWGLAEGRVGGDLAFETYVLLANPSVLPARVRVTLLRQGGRAPVSREFDVAPTSRFNVYVSAADPEWSALGLRDGEGFGAIVESIPFPGEQTNVGIAVERAMYWSAGGVFWTGGTNALATPF